MGQQSLKLGRNQRHVDRERLFRAARARAGGSGTVVPGCRHLHRPVGIVREQRRSLPGPLRVLRGMPENPPPRTTRIISATGGNGGSTAPACAMSRENAPAPILSTNRTFPVSRTSPASSSSTGRPETGAAIATGSGTPAAAFAAMIARPSERTSDQQHQQHQHQRAPLLALAPRASVSLSSVAMEEGRASRDTFILLQQR